MSTTVRLQCEKVYFLLFLYCIFHNWFMLLVCRCFVRKLPENQYLYAGYQYVNNTLTCLLFIYVQCNLTLCKNHLHHYFAKFWYTCICYNNIELNSLCNSVSRLHFWWTLYMYIVSVLLDNELLFQMFKITFL